MSDRPIGVCLMIGWNLHIIHWIKQGGEFNLFRGGHRGSHWNQRSNFSVILIGQVNDRQINDNGTDTICTAGQQ